MHYFNVRKCNYKDLNEHIIVFVDDSLEFTWELNKQKVDVYLKLLHLLTLTQRDRKKKLH